MVNMSEQLKEELEKVTTENDVSRDNDTVSETKQSGKIEDITEILEKDLKKTAQKEKQKEPLELEEVIKDDEESKTDILESKSSNFIFVFIAVIVAIGGAFLYFIFNTKNNDNLDQVSDQVSDQDKQEKAQEITNNGW